MGEVTDRETLRKRQLKKATFSVIGAVFLMVGFPVVVFLTLFRDVFSSNNPSVWQVVLFVLVVTIPAGLGSWFISRISRSFAAETFDPLFTPLGLRASPYIIYGRQYHGQINGRKVDVYLNPTQRQRTFATLPGMTVTGATYFGHVLQIYVEAKSTGKMAMSQLAAKLPQTKTANVPSNIINTAQDWMFTHGLKAATSQISQQYNVTTFTPTQAELKGLSIATFDRPWAEQVCENADIMTSAQPLLALASQTIMFTLQALPASVKLAMHLSKELMTPEAVQSWFTNLVRFAHAIEAGPQPSVTFQETASEHAIRTNPTVYARRAIFLVVSFFILLGLGFCLFLYTMYYFGQLG